MTASSWRWVCPASPIKKNALSVDFFCRRIVKIDDGSDMRTKNPTLPQQTNAKPQQQTQKQPQQQQQQQTQKQPQQQQQQQTQPQTNATKHAAQQSHQVVATPNQAAVRKQTQKQKQQQHAKHIAEQKWATATTKRAPLKVVKPKNEIKQYDEILDPISDVVRKAALGAIFDLAQMKQSIVDSVGWLKNIVKNNNCQAFFSGTRAIQDYVFADAELNNVLRSHKGNPSLELLEIVDPYSENFDIDLLVIPDYNNNNNNNKDFPTTADECNKNTLCDLIQKFMNRLQTDVHNGLLKLSQEDHRDDPRYDPLYDPQYAKNKIKSYVSEESLWDYGIILRSVKEALNNANNIPHAKNFTVQFGDVADTILETTSDQMVKKYSSTSMKRATCSLHTMLKKTGDDKNINTCSPVRSMYNYHGLERQNQIGNDVFVATHFSFFRTSLNFIVSWEPVGDPVTQLKNVDGRKRTIINCPVLEISVLRPDDARMTSRQRPSVGSIQPRSIVSELKETNITERFVYSFFGLPIDFLRESVFVQYLSQDFQQEGTPIIASRTASKLRIIDIIDVRLKNGQNYIVEKDVAYYEAHIRSVFSRPYMLPIDGEDKLDYFVAKYMEAVQKDNGLEQMREIFNFLSTQKTQNGSGINRSNSKKPAIAKINKKMCKNLSLLF